jgi:hypothetical protein
VAETIANIIEVDKDMRYLVTYEWDTDYEYVVGDLLGVQALQVADRITRLHTKDSMYEVYARIVGTVMPDYNVGGWDKVARIFSRYLTFCGVANRIVTLQGYSQGEWCEAVVYLTDEATAEDSQTQLANLVSVLESWWRGDVYRVERQYRQVYTHADGREIERWETDEDASVAGGVTDEVTLEWCEREGI